MWEKIKDFYYDHSEVCIGGGILTVLAALILFLAIPISGEMKVDRTRWIWTIPIEEYKVCSHSSESHPPSDAYDIYTTLDTHYRTVTDSPAYMDSDGHHHAARTHQEVYYTTRYHYKRNEWCKSHSISEMGFDKKPHEPECDKPFDVPNPQLGDLRRRDHTERYEVIGLYNEKTSTFEVDEADWEKIEQGGIIQFKKLRFGDKLFDITFGRKGGKRV